jgi:hypothetical protein
MLANLIQQERINKNTSTTDGGEIFPSDIGSD